MIRPPTTCRAMQYRAGEPRLQAVELRLPELATQQVLVRVHACGVCRTDLHIIDGELAPHRTAVVPGHEIVGEVVACGSAVAAFDVGQRLGIPWLAGTCGGCHYCRTGRENLCTQALFTGYDRDGGFAEYAVADARYCLPLPDRLTDTAAAPLLCAGLIGYRALRAAGDAGRLGIYGFGAAAHIVAQIARHEGREVHAFTRPGDPAAQRYALTRGAVWAGSSDQPAPVLLDAAIIFAPVGSLVPAALRAVAPGGTVVCAGIHMSDIPAFSYQDLWRERSLRSIANLTRRDGLEFMQIAERVPFTTDSVCFPLLEANTAIERLRNGNINGAAVLTMPR